MHLREMGFVGSRADPDFWMKPASKPDGTEYCQHLVCYVDNVADTMENPKESLDEIGRRFTIKDGSVKEPDICILVQMSRSGTWQNQKNLERLDGPGHQQNIQNKPLQMLKWNLMQLTNNCQQKVTTPLTSGYRPELDQSRELNAERLNDFQGLIGILQWICELG